MCTSSVDWLLYLGRFVCSLSFSRARLLAVGLSGAVCGGSEKRARARGAGERARRRRRVYRPCMARETLQQTTR